MFRAQFLATALSACFTPALANTGVHVPTGIVGVSCKKVKEVLTFGNVNDATRSANETIFMTVTSIYDINNNNRVTCIP